MSLCRSAGSILGKGRRSSRLWSGHHGTIAIRLKEAASCIGYDAMVIGSEGRRGYSNTTTYWKNNSGWGSDVQILDVPSVLEKYARQRSVEGAIKAEDLLKKIVEQEEEEWEEEITDSAEEKRERKLNATTKLFPKVLDTWAKSGDEMAPVKAEELLSAMFQRHMANGSSEATEPCRICFGAVMDAWACSTRPGAAQRAEEILRWMEMMHKTAGNDRLKPSTVVFNILIKAWSNSPDADAASRAEDVLKWMARSHQQTAASDTAAVVPDVISFTSVIRAWSQKAAAAADHDAATAAALRAQRILHFMEHLHTQNHPDVAPTRRTYLQVMKAWSNTHDPAAPFRIEFLLKRMHRLSTTNSSQQSDAHLDVNAFNRTIAAWAYSKLPEAPQNASNILSWMESKTIDIEPNMRSYTLTMKAWAYSRHPNAPIQLQCLLQKLIALNHKTELLHKIQPNTLHFNLVISACAYSKSKTPEQKNKVFKIAFHTYHALLRFQDAQPDTVTYLDLIRVCMYSMPPERQREKHERIMDLYRMCRDERCVDGRVLRSLRKALPKDLFRKVLKEESSSDDHNSES